MSFVMNLYNGGTQGGANGLAVMEAATINNEALRLSREGDYAAAEALHKEALNKKIEAMGPDSIQAALSRNALGEVQLKLGKLDEAEASLKEAVRVRNALNAGFDAAVSRENLAQVYEAKGDLAAAKEMRLSGNSTNSMACGHYKCPGTTFPFNRLKTCSKCHSVFYCSVRCQTQDWKTRHKNFCKQRA